MSISSTRSPGRAQRRPSTSARKGVVPRRWLTSWSRLGSMRAARRTTIRSHSRSGRWRREKRPPGCRRRAAAAATSSRVQQISSRTAASEEWGLDLPLPAAKKGGLQLHRCHSRLPAKRPPARAGRRSGDGYAAAVPVPSTPGQAERRPAAGFPPHRIPLGRRLEPKDMGIMPQPDSKIAGPLVRAGGGGAGAARIESTEKRWMSSQ